MPNEKTVAMTAKAPRRSKETLRAVPARAASRLKGFPRLSNLDRFPSLTDPLDRVFNGALSRK
ncbi:MAG: hypothetical protein WDN31_17210 [Hyphomicrobium sp.]